MTARPSAELIAQLHQLLGDKGFSQDPDTLQPWLTDWRGKYHGAAAALLSPATTQEVAAIVRLCAQHKAILVPQGGNSGMVGGATPDASGDQFILSLRRMDQIRKLDVASRQIVAEAGVILANLHDITEAKGLRFPLTLGGKGSATVGGLISTNAGGTQVLRHGTMRALVDGIEAVLPDGSIFDGLSPLKKDNRGYDLRHLLCGAEGTLGIVTAATLRLVPAIADRCAAWIGLASPDKALLLLRHLESRLGPSLEGFELVPHSCLESVLAHIPQTRAPLAQPSPWNILIELAGDGAEPMVDQLIAGLEQPMTDGLVEDVVIAKNEAEADAFWRLRDSISESERAKGPAIQHDISVPVDLMPTFIAENPPRLDAHFPGIGTLSFGHLGDGNVHYHVRPPAGCDAAVWVARHEEDVNRIVYGHVAELGGSLSAEHGIGQAKLALLAEMSEPARVAMLRAVKAGLDPSGLFNPGKLVP